jgi:hypothetical protein
MVMGTQFTNGNTNCTLIFVQMQFVADYFMGEKENLPKNDFFFVILLSSKENIQYLPHIANYGKDF